VCNVSKSFDAAKAEKDIPDSLISILFLCRRGMSLICLQPRFWL